MSDSTSQDMGPPSKLLSRSSLHRMISWETFVPSPELLETRRILLETRRKTSDRLDLLALVAEKVDQLSKILDKCRATWEADKHFMSKQLDEFKKANPDTVRIVGVLDPTCLSEIFLKIPNPPFQTMESFENVPKLLQYHHLRVNFMYCRMGCRHFVGSHVGVMQVSQEFRESICRRRNELKMSTGIDGYNKLFDEATKDCYASLCEVGTFLRLTMLCNMVFEQEKQIAQYINRIDEAQRVAWTGLDDGKRREFLKNMFNDALVMTEKPQFLDELRKIKDFVQLDWRGERLQRHRDFREDLSKTVDEIDNLLKSGGMDRPDNLHQLVARAFGRGDKST